MKALLAIALLALASGCASTGGAPAQKDPWERFNRGTHEFNDGLDRLVLKPAAQSYVAGVPGFAQEGISNFFANVADIGTGVNNLLQGKFADGASDLARFAMNTVVGIGGLWDVATPMGLEKHDEDFGQTLGWWGMPSGPYLVLPVFGPSSLRDAPARFVDPSLYYGREIGDAGARGGLAVLDVVQIRAGLLKAERILDEAALDRYTFTRDAWLQRRRHHVHDGRPPRDPEDE